MLISSVVALTPCKITVSIATAHLARNRGQFGFRVPDLVLNARLDQSWGYAGVSVVAHDASGGYYNTPNNVNNGHPADKYGWAVGGGGQVNLPGGDSAGIMVVVSEGATGYATNAGHWQLYKGSTSVGHAWATDGVFDTGSKVELTRAWSINAGYQHFWGSAGTFGGKWRTSIYGGYAAIEYNDRAKFLINDRLPVGSPCKPGVAAATITGFTPLAGNSCSPDASWWQVGSRTQFNPHPLLDVGLDVFYTRLNSAYKGPTNLAANGSRPACTNNAPAGLAVQARQSERLVRDYAVATQFLSVGHPARHAERSSYGIVGSCGRRLRKYTNQYTAATSTDPPMILPTVTGRRLPKRKLVQVRSGKSAVVLPIEFQNVPRRLPP